MVAPHIDTHLLLATKEFCSHHAIRIQQMLKGRPERRDDIWVSVVESQLEARLWILTTSSCKGPSNLGVIPNLAKLGPGRACGLPLLPSLILTAVCEVATFAKL